MDLSHRVRTIVEFEFNDLVFDVDNDDPINKITPLQFAKETNNEELNSLITSIFTCTTPQEVTHYLKGLIASVNFIDIYDGSENEECINSIISKVIRVALIFQTTPLSDEEIAIIMSINLAEGDLQQLIALGTNEHILGLNKRLLKIYTMPTKDVPLMDTSEIPYLGPSAIYSIFHTLTDFLADGESHLLTMARNNFGIAIPKLIFSIAFEDMIPALEVVAVDFEPYSDLMELYLKAFQSRFNNKKQYILLASHYLECLRETAADQNHDDFSIENMSDDDSVDEYPRIDLRCMIAAISFTAFLSTQNSYDTSANVMIEMAIRISKCSVALLKFFRGIELKLLLYKMKNFYLEFQARKRNLDRNKNPVEAKKLDNISEDLNIILFEHLEKIVSLQGDQRKLACMLIEHITLWTDSATLMANLAFRWATLTEYSLHALKVLNVLILLVTDKPHFLSRPDTKATLSNFMKRTCEGALFNSKGNSFIDFANQQRKKHLKLIRPHPLINIEQQYNVAKGMKETFHLRSFLINMYFNTSESEWQEGRLLSSYHNLFNEDLPKIPENKIKTIPVYCANISIANEGVIITEERGLSSTNLFVDLKNSHETKSATRKRRKMNEVENFVKIALGKRNCLEAPNEITHDVKRIYPAEQQQLGVDFQCGVGGNLHGPKESCQLKLEPNVILGGPLNNNNNEIFHGSQL